MKQIEYFSLKDVRMSLLPPSRIIECNVLNGEVRLIDRNTFEEHFKVRFTDHEFPLIRTMFEVLYAPYDLLLPLTDDGDLQTVRGLITRCEYRLEGLGLAVAAVKDHGFLLLKKREVHS